jgi:transposase
MKLKGMSNNKITELTGINLSSVKDFVKRYDLPKEI